MKNTWYIIWGIIIILVIFWIISNQTPKGDNTVLCKINDDKIMEQEVRDTAEEVVKTIIAEKYRDRCKKQLGAGVTKEKNVKEELIKKLETIEATGTVESFQ